ncbi:hypothetical protein JK361_08580 [Streptomyces sp. 5-8]|uniref:Integral membrane protein n=1 Tax=Streptomyces musisoli TaxID=2802280 RepID=A0ABS1NX37_9ACTN|nr:MULTISPECIES: hypothetical protein [Streptomyces]MBL1104648.1 hypothetical protein [Streptomyces musisoli]MBY8846117.1 hypothetical protein [Streptomyces sp. SP2-10]
MTTVSRLARHELRLFASLALWLARRTEGAAAGQAFGYARGQGATMLGLAFVCVVETVGVSFMLRDMPVAHDVLLVLDVYTVLFVLGLHAACTVRPHVLTTDALRVRYGAHVDLRIPLTAITAVRRETRSTHGTEADALDLAVGSQTTVTLELAEPVVHTSVLGRRRRVSVVRLYADDSGSLVRALTPG